jgi:hypothetical protein
MDKDAVPAAAIVRACGRDVARGRAKAWPVSRLVIDIVCSSLGRLFFFEKKNQKTFAHWALA